MPSPDWHTGGVVRSKVGSHGVRARGVLIYDGGPGPGPKMEEALNWAVLFFFCEVQCMRCNLVWQCVSVN